eukprot:COSAG05_NODE_4284_length_1584_cov_1.119865_1_plen_52_part_10
MTLRGDTIYRSNKNSTYNAYRSPDAFKRGTDYRPKDNHWQLFGTPGKDMLPD